MRRVEKLLFLLKHSKKPLSLKLLAKKLSCSKREVRYIITRLLSRGNKVLSVISSTEHGYILLENASSQTIEREKNNLRHRVETGLRKLIQLYNFKP